MARMTPIARRELLRSRLDALVETFDITTLTPDPLELVRRYSRREDQEVAGIIAAAFAYGRADIIVANIGAVLTLMEPSPAAYLRTFDRKEASRRFTRFSHRFHKAPDLLALFERLAAVVERYGSLGALFEECYDAEDADIAGSLTRFVSAIIHAVPAKDESTSKALRYLLTSPADGSACKRMNLFLRWMVRRDAPDVGLWGFVDPAKLVVPLDTHVHRITTFLGLNVRRTADWKTARQLTDRLAGFNADDPVRYDFAICRLGILDRCSRKRAKANCDVCLLNDVCRLRLK